jgi:O-antigen ligase
LGIALGVARAASMPDDGLGSYWRGLYVCATVACVLSFVLLAVFPVMALDLADPGAFRLKGVTGSANSLGPIMTVGSIICISMFKLAEPGWRRWQHVFWGGLMLAALFLTNSRSSWIGLGACLLFATFIGRCQSILSLLLALLGLTIAAAVVLMPSLTKIALGVVTELLSRSGRAVEITSFTGRSDIWEACLRIILEKPWFGYGLGSVRVEIPLVFRDSWGNTAATAHNFLLESLISVGVVGTVWLLAAFVLPTVGLTRLVGSRLPVFSGPVQREWAVCALRCLLMLWVHSLVERAFAGTAAPSTVVLGLCIATYGSVAIRAKMLNDTRRQRILNLR